MITKKLGYLGVVLLIAFCAVGVPSSAQGQSAVRVSGCKVLRYPSRYNGTTIIVKGQYTAGFERSDITFGCPGSITIQLSMNPIDRDKYGFLTEQSTVDAMAQLPPGEHPGDNLTARKLRYALVTVVGLFRCRYDFPTCEGASPHDGSIIVKSMQFDTPMSEKPPVLKPSAPGHTLLLESGHTDQTKQP
jgi:hypothetical protein